MTRTVAVDHVTDEMRLVYDTVLNAQLAGIACCKAGVTGRDVDAAGRRIIEQAGYGDAFGHGFGHGVGLEIHEAPMASPRGNSPSPPAASSPPSRASISRQIRRAHRGYAVRHRRRLHRPHRRTEIAAHPLKQRKVKGICRGRYPFVMLFRCFRFCSAPSPLRRRGARARSPAGHCSTHVQTDLFPHQAACRRGSRSCPRTDRDYAADG